MHVMGSHWENYLRYPKSFQRFAPPQNLSMLTSATTYRSMVATLADAYDNFVLYTDWFLQQAIKRARALQVPATVTFIPDHGEASPYLDGGAVRHRSAHYVPADFEIPAFIRVNDAYRNTHPEKVGALEANASAPGALGAHDTPLIVDPAHIGVGAGATAKPQVCFRPREIPLKVAGEQRSHRRRYVSSLYPARNYLRRRTETQSPPAN
jgi:Sulfatase